MLSAWCRSETNSARIVCNENQQEDWDVRMSLHDDQVEFAHLRARLDNAQLERTITALHQIQTLPETKASEAEATLRRMYARAKRWED